MLRKSDMPFSGIFLFWDIALKVLPSLKTRPEKVLALANTLCGCALIFFLSCVFNVAGMTGKDALEKHVSVYVGSLEEVVDERFRQSQLVDGLGVDVRGEAIRYKRAAESEFTSGVYSGQGSKGAVFNALNSIGGRLERVADETDKFTRERERLGRHARSQLEKIRKIASSDKPLNERMRQIARESDELRADLVRMDPRQLAESVARTLDALPGEVDLQSDFSGNAQVAEQQEAALTKIREDIERSSDKLGSFIEKATSNDVPQIKSFDQIRAVRAVIVYWQNYIPFWVGGIVLDIAPLAVVFFLMIAVNARTPQEIAITRILGLRVRDLVDAQVAAGAIRSGAADPAMLKAIFRFLLGEEKPDDAD